MRWRRGALRWRYIVCGAALVLSAAGPAAGATLFTDEAEFVVAISGLTSFQEGFEDDGAWGPSRNPEAVASVTSQGVTSASNHSANGITTGSGPARTGDWGFYSDPHGDQSVPNPTDFIEDNKAAIGHIVEDIGHLIHLHHKGALSFADVIVRADPGKNFIDNPDLGFFRRDIASDLRNNG